QRKEMMAHAARAVGVLVAEFRLVARRLQHLDASEVRAELVGDDRLEAGANALAHLGADGQQVDRAVVGVGEDVFRIVLHATRYALAAEFLFLRLSRQPDRKDEAS